MKKAIGIAAIGLATLLFMAGQSSVVSAAGLPDSSIISVLHSKLAGHNAAYRGVDACSTKGSVLLHGTVKSEELKMKAEEYAKSINGVTEVKNDIVVK
ncbi:hypothetical protein YTPLAS18_33070 [Nitrospira sp.]|nr:hypothetical protein YTPLAS18_33070 [Nitrospira sp.]